MGERFKKIEVKSQRNLKYNNKHSINTKEMSKSIQTKLFTSGSEKYFKLYQSLVNSSRLYLRSVFREVAPASAPA